MSHLVTIKKAHNYLIIDGYTIDFHDRVLRPFFLRYLYLFDTVRIPGTQQTVKKVTHVFARRTKDLLETRISAGLYDLLMRHLMRMGIGVSDIKEEIVPEMPYDRVDFKWRPNWGTPLEHQLAWTEYQLAEGGLKINNAGTGQGKAAPLYTKVLTPSGWKLMGDIKVGDEVITRDGRVVKVTGVFPQGLRQCYNLITEDNRKPETADCHLWKIVNSNNCKLGLFTTEEVITKLKNGEELYLPTKSGDWSNTVREKLQKFITGGCGTLFRDDEGFLNFKTQFKFIVDLVKELVLSNGGLFKYEVKDEVYYCKLRKSKVVKLVGYEPTHITEVQCISIDDPEHLYIMDDYIVTHNTFMSTHTMVNTGARTLITCLPGFIDIWVNNFDEKLELKPKDLFIIDDSDLFSNSLLIKNGTIDPKIIILPLSRLNIWMGNSRNDPINYPSLDVVYGNLGVGLRIMDESHMHIHQVYSSMLYGNFHKTIALSATIEHDDPFINSIYGYMFPEKHRHLPPEYKKYIDVYSYHHRVDLLKYRMQYKTFKGYNHIMYEKSILRSKMIFNYYAELYYQAFKEFYLEHEDYEPDQKSLFFFSTVKMVDRMYDYFKKRDPSLDIIKYTNKQSKQKDKKNSYQEHQIIITTPKSCGVGKDIAKLFVVFSPYAVSSSGLLNQMVGRLRETEKWWKGKTPKYVMFTCINIDKHRDYVNKAKLVLGNKTKSFKSINSGLHLS